MIGTEWNTEEEKMKEDFLWALGNETRHQVTQSEYRTDPEKKKIR